MSHICRFVAPTPVFYLPRIRHKSHRTNFHLVFVVGKCVCLCVHVEIVECSISSIETDKKTSIYRKYSHQQHYSDNRLQFTLLIILKLSIKRVIHTTLPTQLSVQDTLSKSQGVSFALNMTAFVFCLIRNLFLILDTLHIWLLILLLCLKVSLTCGKKFNK